jgi:hypothetical protein
VKQPRSGRTFHGKLDGETAPWKDGSDVDLDDYSRGLLIGLLAGEGHFGGDGRQAQVTLRMHVRHEKLFRWISSLFPHGRLYGPYTHGGRHYYQWMARGRFLREEFVPLIGADILRVDDHVAARFRAMCERYDIAIPGDPAAL